MKKLVLALVVILAFASSAFAQKIAVVDIQRAAMLSDAGVKASAEMQKLEGEYGGNLQKMRDSIATLDNDYRAQEKVLTDAAKKAKTAEIQKKYEEYQATAMGYENTLQQKNDELTRTILLKLQDIIPAVAKAGGYDIVLQAQTLVCGPNVKDITDDVIKSLNQQLK